MSQNHDMIRERLSALADGELDRREAALLLARLMREPELCKTWERYHFVREALRGGALTPAHARTFAERVRQAIENEPATRFSLDIATIPGWFKPLAGLAVAASVALVAILGIQQQVTSSDGAEVVPLTDTVTPGAATTAVSASAGHSAQPAELALRLGSYLVNHNEYAVGHDMQGMMPYVRIAVFDGHEMPVEETPAKLPRERNDNRQSKNEP